MSDTTEIVLEEGETIVGGYYVTVEELFPDTLSVDSGEYDARHIGTVDGVKVYVDVDGDLWLKDGEGEVLVLNMDDYIDQTVETILEAQSFAESLPEE